MGIVTILLMDMAITRTGTIDHTDTMVMVRRIIGTTMGTMAIEVTVITAIIATIITKLT